MPLLNRHALCGIKFIHSGISWPGPIRIFCSAKETPFVSLSAPVPGIRPPFPRSQGEHQQCQHHPSPRRILNIIIIIVILKKTLSLSCPVLSRRAKVFFSARHGQRYFHCLLLLMMSGIQRDLVIKLHGITPGNVAVQPLIDPFGPIIKFCQHHMVPRIDHHPPTRPGKA